MKSAGFRYQLDASRLSSHIEEFWYNETVRGWQYIYYWITRTRKFGNHLQAKYRTLNGYFDLIRSHQQCIPWSPPLVIELTTTEYRSRNSTIGPSVHITHKRRQVNLSWWNAWPLNLMCLEGTWPLQRTQSPPGLMCDMHRWPSGKFSTSAFCGRWVDLQWWRSRYALLMKPNQVETPVQCSVCRI